MKSIILCLCITLTLSACQTASSPTIPAFTPTPLPSPTSTAIPSPTPAPTPTTDPEAQAVRAARQALNDDFVKRDFKALVMHLTVTASLTGPAQQAKGLSSMRDLLEGMTQARPDLVFDFEPVNIQINHQWNLASENGTWLETWTEHGELTTLTGTYSALWKKTTATWLMDAELFIPLECSGSSYCNHSP